MSSALIWKFVVFSSFSAASLIFAALFSQAKKMKRVVRGWLPAFLLGLLGGQVVTAEGGHSVRPERFQKAVQLVEDEVASGAVGAAALLVAQDGKILLEQGFGGLTRDRDPVPCNPESVFLVASISKPVTALAVMCLVNRGQLQLDDPVQKYLPGFVGDARGKVTIRNLLSHTSGLPDMLPNNLELRKRHAPLKEFVDATLKTPLLFEPGQHVSYQSMGVLLAAEIVERVSGKGLDAFLQQEVFRPLKMRHSSMGISKKRIARTVQCDLPIKGDLLMRDGDGDWDWNSVYWRTLGAPWGGMHSTVGDIYRLLQAMLDHGRSVLKPELAILMESDQNRGLNRPWGLGWEIGADAFYDGSPPKMFGHHGATGTVCWADPDRRLIFVLFTNRPLVNDPNQFLRQVGKTVAESESNEN